MNSAEKWEVTKAEARKMSTDELNEALEKSMVKIGLRKVLFLGTRWALSTWNVFLLPGRSPLTYKTE